MTSNPPHTTTDRAGDLAGVAPVPSAVGGLDWSGSPAEAAVGRLLASAQEVDRWTVRLVEDLIRAVESGATDDALGVAVELVLSQSARMVRFERTTLLRVATTLAAMPAVRAAFRDGWISFSQVKAIVTAVTRVDTAGRDAVDDLVGRVAHDYRDHEADALVHEVDWLVDQLVADRRATTESRPVEVDRATLMPRLDGSGAIYSEHDADHFPLFVQAIDNLADERHPFETEPDPDDLPDDTSDAALTEAHRHAWRVRGRNATRRGKALFELVTGLDHDTLTPLEAGRSSAGRPSVLLTCTVQALLDGTAPAWVLNRLGGRISVTADTARRWVDAAGADTNLFLYDECGEVVGHGHRQRHARGWLRDAIIARDLHDTAPCSTTPALLCDIDHLQAWEHGGPTDPPGPGPTGDAGRCERSEQLQRARRARWHTAKTKGHWAVTHRPDGSRTWTQTRSGYTISQPGPPHLTPRAGPTSPRRRGGSGPGRDLGPGGDRDAPRRDLGPSP